MKLERNNKSVYRYIRVSFNSFIFSLLVVVELNSDKVLMWIQSVICERSIIIRPTDFISHFKVKALQTIGAPNHRRKKRFYVLLF